MGGRGGGVEWGLTKDGLVTSTDNVRLEREVGGWGHPKDGLVISTDNVRLGGGGLSWGTPRMI